MDNNIETLDTIHVKVECNRATKNYYFKSYKEALAFRNKVVKNHKVSAKVIFSNQIKWSAEEALENLEQSVFFLKRWAKINN